MHGWDWHYETDRDDRPELAQEEPAEERAALARDAARAKKKASQNCQVGVA